jgi:membrane fusion protein (multidrug efflux system)
VVERRAHEGALAGSAPVLVLQESGALEAILDVPENSPVAVRAGDSVRLFAQGLATPLTTSVARVSERVDPGTRTYQVRCAVADPSGGVKAGSYVRAEINASRGSAYPVAPRSAVVTRDGRSYVLRVEDGVARETPVRVGIVAGERVELLAGVSVGDRVVHGEAAQRLADGAEIDAASLATPAASAPLASAEAEAAP